MAEREAIEMYVNCYMNHEDMYVVISFCNWNGLNFEDVKEKALDIILGLEDL